MSPLVSAEAKQGKELSPYFVTQGSAHHDQHDVLATIGMLTEVAPGKNLSTIELQYQPSLHFCREKNYLHPYFLAKGEYRILLYRIHSDTLL